MDKIHAKGLTKKEYLAKYRREHPEKYAEYSIKNRPKLYLWRKNNPEKYKAIEKRYYEKNKEKRKEQSRARYWANKQKALANNRKWRAKNKEKVKLYRHNRELALKRGIKKYGRLLWTDIRALNIFQENICNECFKKMGDAYTIDHIIPISKGGEHVNYNIQLLCHPCNSMKQARILERDIQYTILQYLKAKKIFSYKNSTAGIYKKATGSYIPSQSVGSPDIIAVIDGVYVGIEVKGPKGKQSADQKQFQKDLEKAGGLYILARSVEDVDKGIGGYYREKCLQLANKLKEL